MLWQQTVERYSRRHLSFEADKLVALAGAAHQVSQVLDDTFLAGLWVNSLWRDLLWWSEAHSASLIPSTRYSRFRASSWSWASIHGPISYKFPSGTSYLRYYPCIQVLGHAEKVHGQSNSVSGVIKIRGVLLPASITNETAPQHATSDKGTQNRTATIKSRVLRPGWSSIYNKQWPYWRPDTNEFIIEIYNAWSSLHLTHVSFVWGSYRLVEERMSTEGWGWRIGLDITIPSQKKFTFKNSRLFER